MPLKYEAEQSNMDAQQSGRQRSSLSNTLEQVSDSLPQHDRELSVLVQERTNQVRALSAALVQAEEWERQRIAKRLHSQLQPLLHGLQMRMQLLAQDIAPNLDADQRTQLAEIDALVEDAIEQARTFIHALSPPVSVEDDLHVALEWLAYIVQEVHGLTVDFHTTDETQIGSHDVRILLYQCVRELLLNVVKHSGVDHATIRIFCNSGYAIVQVDDEGFGFLHRGPGPDTAQLTNRAGLGLGSIRERLQLIGGRLEIDSQVGQGARISLFVPL